MGVEREKDWFLPEAQDDGIFVPWQPQAPEDDDAPPDPWERPDLPDLGWGAGAAVVARDTG